MSYDAIDVLVGGVNYSTSRRHLTKFRGSVLAELFGNSRNAGSSPPGKYRIDRDGHLFGYVLRYVERGFRSLPSPETFTKYQELSAEAKYFGLPSMERDIAVAMPDWCIVELNVGGTHFTTTKGTLCGYRGSFLWQLFNPAGSVVTAAQYARKDPGLLRYYNSKKAGMPVAKALRYVTDREGRLVIDRDGEMFGYILTVLRTGWVDCPEELRGRLWREAEFYGLHPMVAIVQPGYKGRQIEL